MRRHPKQTKKWIMIVRICMKQFKKEQKKRDTRKQKKLTKYFQKKQTRIIGKGVGKEQIVTTDSDRTATMPDIAHIDTG